MIRVERLSLSCTHKQILKDVSFQVECGETLALIGESGAGKTTLARLLLGLIDGGEDIVRNRSRGFRWSGAARVGNLDVLRATPSQLRAFRGRQVGLIVQALSDALNPHLTVLEHIQEMASSHSLPPVEPSELCRSFNIPANLHHRFPSGLSGGEIQRVLTALALITRPRCLILDEPTASLDMSNREQAIRTFEEGRAERCQLLITHDVDLARRLADRIAVLRHGRLIETGPAADVLDRPKHPYTRTLIRFAPGIGSTSRKGRPVQRRSGRNSDKQPRLDISNDGDSTSRPEAVQQKGLRINSLSHAFDGVSVLREISLFVPSGTCLAVMGASGCGKSTFARLLTGFEKIQSGTVEWCPATRSDHADRCATIHSTAVSAALISQHPHRAMARHFTVEDVLEEAVELTRKRCRWTRTSHSGADGEQIRTMLSQVGLPMDREFLSQKTVRLSGGEAQRLVIARALASNPVCLVADEPTSALDMCARAQILNLLKRLKHQREIALILFTHDPTAAQHLSDRIVQLENGRLTERQDHAPQQLVGMR